MKRQAEEDQLRKEVMNSKEKHSKIVQEMVDAGEEEQPKKEEKGPEEAAQAPGPQIKMKKINISNKKSSKGAKGTAGSALQREPEKKRGLAGASSTGFSLKDIEFIKTAIQMLCQSTNPLGKSIDFINEDIESMSKEYEYWRKQYQSSQGQLEEQLK